jgi:oligoribonuclease NrnB/cAMP/cGMP phosphodiesterase (DHH superfamily)
MVWAVSSTAFAGRFSEEEHREKVKGFVKRDYVKDQLEKVRAHKEKLLKKIAWDEDYEQMLLEELERRNCS